MFEPTYRQALARSWQLIWHDKVLWIFGLLSIVLGQFGLSNFIGQLLFLANQDSFSGYASWWPSYWVWQVSGVQQVLGIVWVLVLAVAVGALILMAAVGAQGALIAAAADWFKNKTKLNLSKAWNKGVKHFWKILMVNILRKALLSLILLGVMAMFKLVFPFEGMAAFLGKILSVSLGTFFALVVTGVSVYSLGYIVEEGKPLLASIGKGWRLFVQHILVSLELSILLLVLNMVLIGVIIFGSLFVLVPSFFLWLAAGFTGYTSLLVVGWVVAVFLFIILVGICGAAFNAFNTSAWMYLFMKMRKEGILSRILHHTERLFRR